MRSLSFLICSVVVCSAVSGLSVGAWAQEAAGAGIGLEANFIAGRVLKHTPNFRLPIPDWSQAVELNLVRQTDGRKEWQQRRHYPVWGLGFTYTHYGVDSVYGQCLSLYPNIQLNLVKGRRLEWTLRLGIGFAYVTRHNTRAPEWDTLNNAISSTINNFTMFATDLRYRISDRLDIQTGFNFSHISNAAFRQPNLGINMYGAHIGLRYFPVSAHPQHIVRSLPDLKNRWLAQLRLTMALNEAGSADGPMYPSYLVSAFVSRRYASRNKVFAGLDYSYHERVEAFLKNNEIFPGEEKAHSWKSAVFAGNEFLLGRVGVFGQLGYYLKNAYLNLGPYYEKLGVNIYVVQKESGPLKELCVSLCLKAHKTEAELAEFGLGLGF